MARAARSPSARSVRASPTRAFPVAPVGQAGADQRLEGPVEGVPVAGQAGGRRQPGHRGDPARGEGDAEGAGHHVGRLVGLVEDHHVVLGQDVAAGRDVGAEEVEVDHDHVGLPGPLVGGLGEARLPAGALLGPRALVGPDAHRRPRRRAGLEGELGPVAGEAVLGPGEEAGDLPADGQAPLARARAAVAEAEGGGVGVAVGLGRRLPAEVVAATLEDGPGQPRPQPGRGQGGQVLARQLVLQGLGGGGDDDLARLPGGAEQGPHQVGPRLARPRPRPHHQRMAVPRPPGPPPPPSRSAPPAPPRRRRASPPTPGGRPRVPPRHFTTPRGGDYAGVTVKLNWGEPLRSHMPGAMAMVKR